MNNFFIRFLSDENSVNWFQVNLLFNDEVNCYYNLIVSDDKDIIHNAQGVAGNGNWYNYDFNKIFKYKIKLLKFDGENISLMDQDFFDIKNHNLNIILKSDNEKDIKIWKYYLWLIQIKFNFKFNIIENYTPEQSFGDYVEISRLAYDNYLIKSEKPLTDDYSSLTIITTLFDIIDDNSDIINHPWLVKYIS